MLFASSKDLEKMDAATLESRWQSCERLKKFGARLSSKKGQLASLAVGAALGGALFLAGLAAPVVAIIPLVLAFVAPVATYTALSLLANAEQSRIDNYRPAQTAVASEVASAPTVSLLPNLSDEFSKGLESNVTIVKSLKLKPNAQAPSVNA